MKLWPTLFALAAFWNGVVGGAMLAAPGAVAARLGVSGAGGAYAVAMTGLLIAVFGVGYAMVAVAPARNRGVVWIGMLSKVGAGGLGAAQFAAGVIPASTFALGLGDLAFAAAFALFLWRGPRAD